MHRGWAAAAVAIVVLGTLSAIGIGGGDDSPTAEHCLTETARTKEYSAAFERAATRWLLDRGYLRHAQAYGPLRPGFSDHSLVTGGSKRGEYSATVYLYDDANHERIAPLLGPLYVYARLNASTCAATITGASAG